MDAGCGELLRLRSVFALSGDEHPPPPDVIALVRILMDAGRPADAQRIARMAADVLWEKGCLGDALIIADAAVPDGSPGRPRARWFRTPPPRQSTVIPSLIRRTAIPPPPPSWTTSSLIPRIDLLHLDRVVACSVFVSGKRWFVAIAPHGRASISPDTFARVTYTMSVATGATPIPCALVEVAANMGEVLLQLASDDDVVAQRDAIAVAVTGIFLHVHGIATRWLPNTCVARASVR